jgi:plasmid stabilization system protein ParE
MNYTVVWTRAALRQLNNLWTQAIDPDQVDEAATRVAQTLATDPEQVGESRGDDTRIMFDAPLVVLFVPDPDVCVVYIVSVGAYGHPA